MIETAMSDSPEGLAPVKLLAAGAILRFRCSEECPYAHAGRVVGYVIHERGLFFVLEPTDPYPEWCHPLEPVHAAHCILVREDQTQ